MDNVEHKFGVML